MKRFFKRLFCAHAYTIFLRYDYYNPTKHGLQRPIYKCAKCGKTKFVKNKQH